MDTLENFTGHRLKKLELPLLQHNNQYHGKVLLRSFYLKGTLCILFTDSKDGSNLYSLIVNSVKAQISIK